MVLGPGYACVKWHHFDEGAPEGAPLLLRVIYSGTASVCAG
jgi:hypothetical protein